MTPEQNIKHIIILQAAEWGEYIPPTKIDVNSVDDIYEDLVEVDGHWDALYNIRDGEVETGVLCDSFSRHYENKSVAALAPDGSWVGWTYWYGGGKHGNPDEVDWMCDAYELDVVEEEEVILTRTFTKVET